MSKYTNCFILLPWFKDLPLHQRHEAMQFVTENVSSFHFFLSEDIKHNTEYNTIQFLTELSVLSWAGIAF